MESIIILPFPTCVLSTVSEIRNISVVDSSRWLGLESDSSRYFSDLRLDLTWKRNDSRLDLTWKRNDSRLDLTWKKYDSRLDLTWPKKWLIAWNHFFKKYAKRKSRTFVISAFLPITIGFYIGKRVHRQWYWITITV